MRPRSLTRIVDGLRPATLGDRDLGHSGVRSTGRVLGFSARHTGRCRWHGPLRIRRLAASARKHEGLGQRHACEHDGGGGDRRWKKPPCATFGEERDNQRRQSGPGAEQRVCKAVMAVSPRLGKKLVA